MGRKKTKALFKPRRDLKIVRQLILEGKSEAAIAEHLGVHRATFYRWKKQFPELAATIQKAVQERDEAGTPVQSPTSRYNPDAHPEIVKALLAENLTVKEIAFRLGINIRTLYIWRHRHAEFDQAFEQGMAIRDGNVVRSLIKLAVGFKYKDGDKIKTVLPDFRAVKFYLINRMPEKWRPESAFVKEGQGELTDEWNPRDYTREELRDIIAGRLSE